MAIKEEQAQMAKQELLILWTDYFKPEHLSGFPDLREVFWKAAKLTSDGKVFVVGNNRLESTDSRNLGPLWPAQLIGRVIETQNLLLLSQAAPRSRTC